MVHVYLCGNEQTDDDADALNCKVRSEYRLSEDVPVRRVRKGH
jgi:hypothetical protein